MTFTEQELQTELEKIGYKLFKLGKKHAKALCKHCIAQGITEGYCRKFTVLYAYNIRNYPLEKVMEGLADEDYTLTKEAF